ncbi:endonuclease/exonuclease/phosphatase family protein [Wenzhouxiangella sp. XN24]|uniref:endonuclease/exonuclease/phosphatase family protein n=1 Tax=Wenzhouxiangella sp. XN24 TaxID=2713569 RepID=UPI00197D0A01|nr:endonuclease/exonuclease/phosphatase family protein [Wenzhouxiangella sp. XN24]
MIQIDGLGRRQLERALERGEMPFLSRLLGREHYHLHSHYSGLPSATPAVQGELFYGVKTAVPAFAFRDHETGRMVRMYDADAAERVEARLAETGHEPLLKDGSGYSNNYRGGAAEPHFCPSSMGWGAMLRAANPVVLLTFILSHLYSFVRVSVLLVFEIGLALYDFVRGVVGGQDLIKELKFVPTRVAISVLLREFCVIGGKIDISRGLPVVHINLLGYDEQSHRRGPRSLFAHWTLKGIDDAIARLWRATNRAEWRHYDLWIYSDHGQSAAVPYHQAQGYTLENAVSRAFSNAGLADPHKQADDKPAVAQRARLLGGHRLQRIFSRLSNHDDGTGVGHELLVACLGPVGHVYFPPDTDAAQRLAISRALAVEHRVPVVIEKSGPDSVHAITSQGEFELPREAALLFGEDHPFIDSIGPDLVQLCHHADAGDLVLLGWRKTLNPLSFAEESGAHAGVAPDETHGFALLPDDVPAADHTSGYLRPLDLRQAALRHLGRSESRLADGPAQRQADDGRTLRLMTYNVHSCIGMDGKLDAQRIARVISRFSPDIVALQELDVGRSRTRGIDQAHEIARYLEMDFHFHPAMHLEEELYGDAVLSHLPMRLVKAGALPGLADKPGLEPRGALWVAIEHCGTEIQVINTHLGLSRRERLAQVDALLGEEWLGHEACRDPVIFCGDLNAMPRSRTHRRLARRMRDVQDEAPEHRPRGTFSSRFPSMRIDHVFIGAGLIVDRIDVPDSELVRVASDHLPLLAELRLDRDELPAGDS